MKILFTIFALSLLISCNEDASKNTELNQLDSINVKISDNKDIYGTWTMCSSSSLDMMIQMNTCLTIVFNDNGTGYVKGNSAIIENFSWSLKTPGLKILYNSNNRNFTFPDTSYYADFNKQKDRTDLTLTHYDNRYYLSK